MNNLKSYDEYLNESWLFGSRYKSVIDKLLNYVNKVDINQIVKGNSPYGSSCYRFYIKPQKSKALNEMDPYGEEVEPDEVEVEIENDGAPYRLYINGEKVDCGHFECKKIINIINKRKKNQKRDELDLKLKKAMDIIENA
jgi:hypothetical protein